MIQAKQEIASLGVLKPADQVARSPAKEIESYGR
jgi:hypothetical protein